VLPKRDRLGIFLERLRAATPVSSTDEALKLLSETLNAVEDEFSGVPPQADLEGKVRMCPPQEDNRRAVGGRPSLRRYRSARHNTFIGVNGSIRIVDLDRKVLLDKAGGDGRKTHELEPEGGSENMA